MIDPSDSAFPEAVFVNDPGGIGQGITHTPGLTKRELAAIEIMAAMSAGSMTSLDGCAKRAVAAADLLLMELSRKNG